MRGIPPGVGRCSCPRGLDRRAGQRTRVGQRGMVTFELAIGILTAAMLTIVACWLVALVVLQGRCSEVAAQVARYTARGDAQLAAEATDRASEAIVTVQENNTTVRVSVVREVWLGRLGPVTLEGSAELPKEST